MSVKPTGDPREAAPPPLTPRPHAVLISSGAAPTAGQRFPLRDSINHIGSAQDADVRLTGTGIAPIHAQLWHDRTSWVLRTIDPESGTLEDGDRTRLLHGDHLIIAQWTLVLVERGHSATRTSRLDTTARRPTREVTGRH